MKKRPSRKTRKESSLSASWTLERGRAAIPYIHAIMNSLREHAIEALTWNRRGKILASEPGRPDRTRLLAIQEAENRMHQAEKQLVDAAAELESLDVYCLDPLAGQAMLPFIFDNQLAWFLYDSFDPSPLQFWRFHSDSEDIRRPLKDMVPTNSAPLWT